jgi:hypothetical protein
MTTHHIALQPITLRSIWSGATWAMILDDSEQLELNGSVAVLKLSLQGSSYDVLHSYDKHDMPITRVSRSQTLLPNSILGSRRRDPGPIPCNVTSFPN